MVRRTEKQEREDGLFVEEMVAIVVRKDTKIIIRFPKTRSKSLVFVPS